MIFEKKKKFLIHFSIESIEKCMYKRNDGPVAHHFIYSVMFKNKFVR